MVDLKTKIERLRTQSPTQPLADDKAARLNRLKSELNQLVNRQRNRAGRAGDSARIDEASDDAPSTPVLHKQSSQGLSRELPGTSLDTPHGPLRHVRTQFPASHRHGTVAIGGATEVDATLVAKVALDPVFADLDFRRALFFDTETTGLAGGTGTLAFLIGLAWFENDQLQIEQLLLTEPGQQEIAILMRVAERVALASCLVSYNGKSFDWPLLCTRFVLNRLALPQARPHLDLLHVARRAFKRRLTAVPLHRVEENVLGFIRQEDIDGAEIPARYFDFLHSGDGSLLAPVIDHNCHDVVALAALLSAVVEAYASTADGQDARDQISLAQVAMRAQDHTQAGVLAQKAADSDDDPDASAEAWVLLARLHRRRKQSALAIEALTQGLSLVERDEEKAAYVHCLLAKIYEHDCKDYNAALAHAEKTAAVEGDQGCANRVQRLRRLADQMERNASGSKPK